MKYNYDTIAPVYDRIASLVYGDKLIRAQRFLVANIPAGATILLIGGGTGWILEEIASVHPSGLQITYVDSSAKMIGLAKKRNTGGNIIEFVTASIETIITEKKFDVILTPFLLDNFTDAALAGLFPVLHHLLRAGGLWLYCDFKNTTKLWQRAMLKFMSLFFRFACGIAASRLPDAAGCFAEHGYSEVRQQRFMDGFVVSKVYNRC